MPSRNCRTRPLSWKIANNEKLAEAVRDGGWISSWVFVNVIASTDNAGRMESGAYQLRDMFFPHHEGVTPSQVESCVNLLHNKGLIIRYKSDKGVWLLQLPKVGNYNLIRGNMSLNSDFPPPTPEDIQRWEQGFNEEYKPLNILPPKKDQGAHPSAVVVEFWNAQPELASARYLTPARQEKLSLRWKSKAFRDNYQAAIVKVTHSNFCRGKNTQGWRATFDWFIKNDDNWVKAFEGKYDNKKRNRFEKY